MQLICYYYIVYNTLALIIMQNKKNYTVFKHGENNMEIVKLLNRFKFLKAI